MRCLVRQGVLEGVLELGEEACLVDELGRLQVGEAPPQLGLGHLGDGLKKGEGEIGADDRRGLEQTFFVLGQPIDPGRQHGLHGGGHLNRLEPLDLTIGSALAHQHLGLDQGANALFQEERISDTATTWPCPSRARSSARCSCSISMVRPTNRVRPWAAAARKRARSGRARTSS